MPLAYPLAATRTREGRKLIAILLAALGALLLVLVVLLVMPLLFLKSLLGSGEWGYPEGSGVPRVYWHMYTSAAGKFKVNPYVLAAIHHHETNFSKSTLPGVRSHWNGCGAAGPMQFGIVGVRPYNATVPNCPGAPGGAGPTWAAYSAHLTKGIEVFRPDTYPLDRDHLSSCRAVPDDVACVYDDFDAIAAAAKKLSAGGADKFVDSYGTRHAILAYNNSQTYLNAILADASDWEHMGAKHPSSFFANGLPVGDTEPRTLERVIAVAKAMDEATRAGQIPYCFGGGHAPRPGPSPHGPGWYCWEGNRKDFLSKRDGLDCSGAVRWLLVQSGYRDPGGIASGQYGSYLKPNPGKRVTFYYRSGSQTGHIYVKIAGRTWQTSDSHRDHGPGWTSARSSDGFKIGHVEGL